MKYSIKTGENKKITNIKQEIIIDNRKNFILRNVNKYFPVA